MEYVIDGIVPISAILILFLFLPWLVFHYLTQLRQARQLDEDSQELFEATVHRVEVMEERVHVLERILDNEVPDWRTRQ
ncbi:envelope stress response membrane protein PspB [Salinisphaera sp. G21_0]|uniref:envelope stress response membrane protein PspB n=1 Tax=Salinisphaera sp. G21_0 TaxID=2821094 RepID=UPI001ADAEAE4|nr:envelope stress response membrane protein PspB [Salinisphaera sp. G21_0]MBO9483007.1 envelope stress response membrane protein PspB [Salinisphaera sp. G21_0]